MAVNIVYRSRAWCVRAAALPFRYNPHDGA